jgi:hypothetical protein
LFYGTFVIACVWSLGQLLEALPIAPTIVAGAGVLVFALWWSPSNDLITATDPNFVAMDKANRALAPVIFREISLAGEKVDGEAEALSTVLIASPGPVFDASLEFLARLQGVRAKFTALYTAQSWPEVANSVAAANVIVATESGALGQGVGFTYPVIGFQNRLIGMLQQDPSVRTIGTYTDPTGHRTIAFAWRRGGGARVTKISGFRSLEGPYPDLRLPKFRWMTGLNAAVEVVALEAVEATLELRCKAVNPTVLTATIKDGGSSQVRLEGPFNGDFSRLNLKISLKPDQPVVVELKAVPEVEIPKGWPGPLLCAPFSLSSQ